MHPTDFPQEFLDRLVQRRGRVHPFEAIESQKTALVAVDMQNCFCAPGAIGEVAMAREIVPNINLLVRETRAAGGLVVWAQFTLYKKEDWPLFLDTMVKPEIADRFVSDLMPGGEGHKLWPALEPEPDDLFVTKNRFSAFLPSACDLPQSLRERGIDTVLIVGTQTNVCSEGSARDAAMSDFKTIMISDANAAQSDEIHLATLRTFIATHGDVRTTMEAVALLRAGYPKKRIAAE